MSRHIGTLGVTALAAATFLFTGCGVNDSSAPTGLNVPAVSPVTNLIPFEPTPEEVQVCKLYDPGVTGPDVIVDYTIDDQNDGTIDYTGTLTVPAGGCVLLPAMGQSHEHLTVLTERVPLGFVGTYVAKEYHAGVITVGAPVEASVATAYMHGDRGYAIIFTNHSRGLQGCTHGYWKVEQHWDAWPAPFTPTTLFSVAFDDAFPGKTLVEVLALQGGGLNALGREAVAGLLNAQSGFYWYTPAEVQAMFNAEYPGTKDAYTGLKDLLEARNIAGCPLN